MATTPFFTHAEISGVLSEVVPWQPFILQHFAQEHVTNDKVIYFDKIAPDNRIAVFVNPRIPGKARTTKGFSVESYQPGYMKEKDLVLPDHVFARRPGESMGQPLTPEARYAATVVDIAEKQLERRSRRLELMATDLLLYGAYTMSGEQHEVDVDFGRNVANTITLTTTARWLNANTTVSPWQDLEDWLNLCQQPIKTIEMGAAAWRYLKNDSKFDQYVYVDLLSRQAANMEFGLQQRSAEGLTYVGTMPGTGVQMFVNTKTYTDLVTGAEVLYVPTDAVIGIPDSMYGWQCFASIQDGAANFMGMPYFLKNWLEEDPGIPYVMMQCAPMILHTKINSTFSARTGATASGA